MTNSPWTRRKFWDGSEAIFLKNGGCYDLDSDLLSAIIIEKKNALNSEIDEWLKLELLREEYMNGKKSNRSV